MSLCNWQYSVFRARLKTSLPTCIVLSQYMLLSLHEGHHSAVLASKLSLKLTWWLLDDFSSFHIKLSFTPSNGCITVFHTFSTPLAFQMTSLNLFASYSLPFKSFWNLISIWEIRMRKVRKNQFNLHSIRECNLVYNCAVPSYIFCYLSIRFFVISHSAWICTIFTCS